MGQCKLIRANWNGANLTKACLDVVEFMDTDMSGAELRSASITQTWLGNTNMSGAKHVSNVDWTGTRVRGLVLEDGSVLNDDHDW